jgi:hypothetical protein
MRTLSPESFLRRKQDSRPDMSQLPSDAGHLIATFCVLLGRQVREILTTTPPLTEQPDPFWGAVVQ